VVRVTLLPVRGDFFQGVRLLQVQARQFYQFDPATDRIGRGCAAQCLQFGIRQIVQGRPYQELVFQLFFRVG